MMAPIDLVLSRLDGHKLRQHGQGRWRACCPAHGGKNPSALSIGIGREDQVLIQCWQGCTVDEVARSLGLELSDLFPPRPADQHSSPPIKRRHLLTAGQALDLLSAEMDLLIVCASDIVHNKAVDDATFGRLLQAAARVSMLRQEAQA